MAIHEEPGSDQPCDEFGYNLFAELDDGQELSVPDLNRGTQRFRARQPL